MDHCLRLWVALVQFFLCGSLHYIALGRNLALHSCGGALCAHMVMGSRRIGYHCVLMLVSGEMVVFEYLSRRSMHISLHRWCGCIYVRTILAS